MRIKNQSIVILVAVGMPIVVLFFAWFLFSQINNNSQKLFSIKKDITSLDVQNREIENFKQKYQDYKSNLDSFNQLFIDQKNPVDLIKFIENTIHDSGINSSFSLLPAQGQENPDIISFQLGLREDFLKIMDFSEKVQHGPYLVQIKNIVIKSDDQSVSQKDRSPGKVEAVFIIDILTNNILPFNKSPQ